MVPVSGQVVQENRPLQQSETITAVVDPVPQPQKRGAIPLPRAQTHCHNGCVPRRVGSPPGDPPDTRTMGHARQEEAHQLPRAKGSCPGPQGLPPPHQRDQRPHPNRQHDLHVLHTQARGHKIPKTLPLGTRTMGMGHHQRNTPNGAAPGRGPQHTGGPPQQAARGIPRMGTTGRDSGQAVPQVGNARHRPVCHERQQEVQQICIQVAGTGISGGRAGGTLELQPALCVPPDAPATQGTPQAQSSEHPDDPGGTSVASPDMVPRNPTSGHSRGNPSGSIRLPPEQRQRQGSAPRPEAPAPDSMAPEVLEFGHLNLNNDCMSILGAARADSTADTYRNKWKRFCIWCTQKGIHPVLCEPKEVLPYLLHLSREGLQHGSIRVHLAAITCHKKRPGAPSLFTVPVVKQFLKGLLRTFPPVRRPTPKWDLNIVLASLMRRPYEPIHLASMKHLTWKTIFIIAITSARRVGELQALSCSEPFTTFFKDKVSLRTHPNFLPKVVSSFHLNQTISLPVFFPRAETPAERALHTLDAARTLKFYLQRTAPLRKTDQLFVSFGGRTQGRAVTKQSLSRWIVACIKDCYATAGKEVPGRVTAHSTRGKAATSALLGGTPIADICAAATWRSVHTFTKHYCLDVNARSEAAVGQAVLRSLFR